MRANFTDPAKAARRRAITGTLAAILAAAAFVSSAAVPLAGAAQPGGGNGHGKLQLNASSGTIQGNFIEFSTPATGVIVQGFVAEGTAFFDQVAAAGYVKEEESFTGAQVKIRGSNVDAQIHDTPNAIVQLTLDGGTTVSFDLSPGLTASAGADQNSFAIAVSSSNRTATVWWNCKNSTGTLSADRGSFEVAAQEPCHVYFRASVERPAEESAISRAAESGRLMAEVSVGSAEGDADIFDFGATSVVVAHTADGISVSVGPEGKRPSSLVIRFVPDANETIIVSVDGRPVRAADSVADALDATDDGAEIEYALSPNADGSALLVVSVPDSASHVFQIQNAAVTIQPQARDLAPAIIGVAVAMALTAGAALVLFRRR